MSELKDCPFCGGNEVEFHSGWIGGKREANPRNKAYRSPAITCADCGIGFRSGSFGGGISDDQAKEMTVELWNKRVTNPLT